MFWPFRISFTYYSLLGTLIMYIVGLPVSYLTSKEEDLRHLDERLITPMLRKGLRNRKSQLQVDTKLNAAELKQIWSEKGDRLEET